MEVAALIAWVATAAGGFVMLGVWIANGGLRTSADGSSRFPPAVILGHFLLAAVGLVLWIAFVVSDDATGLAWAGFVILLPVALLGFVMLARWLAGRRAGTSATPAAEQRFPVPVVVVHGVLAVTTVVLVLLAAVDAS